MKNRLFLSVLLVAFVAFGQNPIEINYVKNQQEHHKKETFEEEYRRLLREHNIKINNVFFIILEPSYI